MSNASLPDESNPLLDFKDDLDEDFNKLINEWETHNGSMQVIDGKRARVSTVLFFTLNSSRVRTTRTCPASRPQVAAAAPSAP